MNRVQFYLRAKKGEEEQKKLQNKKERKSREIEKEREKRSSFMVQSDESSFHHLTIALWFKTAPKIIIVHFPRISGVSEWGKCTQRSKANRAEPANEWATRVNGRVSGQLLTSRFLVVLNHSGPELYVLFSTNGIRDDVVGSG